MGKITRFLLFLGIGLTAAGCDRLTSEVAAAATDGEENVYRLEYRVELDPAREGARVTLTVKQARNLLRSLDFPVNPAYYSELSGDGSLSINNDRATWRPPATGGSLSWFVKIRRARDAGEFDAYIGPDWALFRGEDIIPRAVSRALKSARSDTYLKFDLPYAWSVVTEYGKRDGLFPVIKPARRFASPSGWILAGKIGTRTEAIAGTRVTVAAPTGHAVRRMDLIALLHWTLPEVLRIIPSFPQRLTVVSAGEPMWRGGLSAEQSFFIHSDRPLISENGTSAPLHEIMHVGLGLSAEPGSDWIVEGLAEYYSIELLRRTGSVSESRNRRTLQSLAEWGKSAKTLRTRNASGSVTARAVIVFADLDREIREISNGRLSLDDVVRSLAVAEQDVSYQRLEGIVTSLIEKPAEALLPENLPGFD
jgi:hypothetical protein